MPRGGIRRPSAPHREQRAVVELSDNGSLRFEVRDDGAGFDERLVTGGMGFTSMRDRVEAVGGVLAVRSRPGHGTRVSASIPLDREPATA